MLLPKDFRAAVSPPQRRFYLVTFLGCVGMGLTLSLYVIYLHNVRHFSISFATALLAVSAVVGLLSAPLWGFLTDHFGPVPTMLFSELCQAVTLVGWAFVRTAPEAIAAGLGLALFAGSGWGPGSTLLTRLTPAEHRQRSFGLNFMMVNMGIGFGSMISSLIVNLHNPASFRDLYLINAGVTLLTATLTMRLWQFGRHVRDERNGTSTAGEGWGVVVRDRRLLAYIVASLVLMIGGYGSQEAGLSLFLVNNVHISIHMIGLILLANTTTIVIAQLFVTNFVIGRSRMRVLALTAVAWATFWFMLGLCLGLPRPVTIFVVFIAMIIFALGETLMSPIGAAFVNDLAPEHLRGRYNAANGITWGVAGTLAPTIVGLYFDNGLANWWPMGTGCLALCAGGGFLLLRRFLSARQDGLARGDEATSTS